MKIHRFPARPHDRGGMTSTTGLVLVSLPVSFGYVQNRSARTTPDTRPKSQMLAALAGPAAQAWKACGAAAAHDRLANGRVTK
jgi:hypothetical protein